MARRSEQQRIAGEIRVAMELMWPPDGVVELRALEVPTGRDWTATISGYFDRDHLDAFAAEAAGLTTQGAKGVYCTLHPVNPALLARAANRTKKSKGKKSTPSTSDHEIVKLAWLPIDTDPKRLAGISSSESEKQAALDRAQQIKEHLAGMGWPEPITADSGNGGHLLYRVDLPPDKAALIQSCLQALSLQFSNDQVEIDEKVFNPARIWKVYGTFARKGDSTPDRPHRQARIISAPASLDPVPSKLLEQLARSNEGEPEPSSKTVAKSKPKVQKKPSQGRYDFNLSEWIAKHIPDAEGPEPWKDGGLVWEIPVCPFNVEHTRREAFISQRPTGEIAAGCPHNSCNWNWHDLREHCEPGHVRRSGDARSIFNPGRTTHMGNAERLIEQFGDQLRFVKEWGWLAWDGVRWVVDRGREEQFYQEMTQSIYQELADARDESLRAELWKWARESESRASMSGSLKMAESHCTVKATTSDFDRDPWLLTCPNGTIDLKTGQLRGHQPQDLMTKQTPVAYIQGATCPTFHAFLERIFQDDEGNPNTELIDFVQRAAGYSLTGNTREHCIFILYGTGRNGKSTLLNVLMGLLGEYGRNAQAEMLTMRKREQNVLVEMADLVGARLVTAVETEGNKRLAEARIKQMSGGDKVKGCIKYKMPFDFDPVWKVWYATNHKPVIRGTDEGIWSRIRLIPFNAFIPDEERDRGLGDKLAGEYPGILKWAVEGCLKWQKEGLLPPQEVTQATAEYRKEQDVLAAFFADCCVFGAQLDSSAKDLYAAYREWCDENGEYPAKQRSFGGSLRERGLDNYKGTGGRKFWIGIKLLDEVDELDPNSKKSSYTYSKNSFQENRSQSSTSSDPVDTSGQDPLLPERGKL